MDQAQKTRVQGLRRAHRQALGLEFVEKAQPSRSGFQGIKLQCHLAIWSYGLFSLSGLSGLFGPGSLLKNSFSCHTGPAFL
jgi:hypothetical protein